MSETVQQMVQAEHALAGLTHLLMSYLLMPAAVVEAGKCYGHQGFSPDAACLLSVGYMY